MKTPYSTSLVVLFFVGALIFTGVFCLRSDIIPSNVGNAAVISPRTPDDNAPADSPLSPKTVIKSEAFWAIGNSGTGSISDIHSHDTDKPVPVMIYSLDTKPALATISRLKAADNIELALPDGEIVRGHVNLVLNDNGALRIGGSLPDKPQGSFSLVLTQENQLLGQILRPDTGFAYIIHSADSEGASRLEKMSIDDVICIATQRDEEPERASAARENAAPILSSRPSATAVVYLSFDGGTVVDPDWNGGLPINVAPSRLSESEIREVWQRVSEDYSIFDINITTSAAVYDNAPVGMRMRCIITPSVEWISNPGGGIAWIGSFSRSGSRFSSTVPCWVFNVSMVSAAESTSHEIGHTMGLRHDGRTQPATEYYQGHGSGVTSWGPIMGAAYSRAIVQWSKGEYDGANNFSDDIAIISNSVNGFGFVPGGAGNTTATAMPLNGGGVFLQNGIIISGSDVDYYTFTLNAPTSLSISAVPAEASPNLDISLQLLNANGAVVGSDSPSLALNAEIDGPLSAGTYYIAIKSSGFADPAQNGYSTYGSAGQYTLTSTVIGPAPAPVITQHPSGQSVTAGASEIILSGNASGSGETRYQWQKNGVDLVSSARIQIVSANTLRITNLAEADTGEYTMAASNSGGRAISNPARVEVIPLVPPVISSFTPAGAAPGSTVVITGSFFAGVTGVFFNNIAAESFKVDSSTQITARAPASLNAPGRISITTNGGPAFSTADFFLAMAPANLTPLVDKQFVTLAHDCSFTGSADANPAPNYYWEMSADGGVTWVRVFDDARHSGATTSRLVIGNVGAEMNNRVYRYIADNGYGLATSNAAKLGVLARVFPEPVSLAIDSARNLYVADSGVHTVQKITPQLLSSVFAGATGNTGSTDATGTAARFNAPSEITFNRGGELLVADRGNATIRKITATGVVTTLAGIPGQRGSVDGAGLQATFVAPSGVGVDATGNIYIADSGAHTIRLLKSDGSVITYAGAPGSSGATVGNGVTARFNSPERIVLDNSNEIYIADTGNSTIRIISADGTILHYAGLAQVPGAVDDFATNARLDQPRGMDVDSADNLYFADTENSTIRMISADGEVMTIAGVAGVTGLQDGTKAKALFNNPSDVALDGNGNLYVADTGNAIIRKIALASGQVTTLAITETPQVLPPPTTGGGTSGGGGGGGGALSCWYLVVLAALAVMRVSAVRGGAARQE